MLPARGKRPLRRGFHKWKIGPGQKIVEEWAESDPYANVVFVPGASRTAAHPNGLVVADGDDAETSERTEQVFGWSPARVETLRGLHRLYRAPEHSLGNVSSLRKYGLNADLKHGASIVVAPPSRHPDERSFAYRWAPGSGIEALRELPVFPVSALQALLERGHDSCPNETQTARSPDEDDRVLQVGLQTLGRASFPEFFRDGSRKLGLNDHLCAHAWAVPDGDFDTLLDIARMWNDDLFDTRGIEPLPETEVIEVCRAVFRDLESSKIVRRRGLRSVCISDGAEVDALANHPEAYLLLQKLRAEHSARCRRGETFAISANAMAENRTLGNWSSQRIRKARDVLLERGFIRCVMREMRGRAAQYVLCDRILTPSIAARRATERSGN